MKDPGNRSTTNTAHGSAETLVQTGAVHGDVHIGDTSTQRVPVPRQLPLPTTGFVDRTQHLRRLDALAETTGTGAAVAVLAGPPGVGKSALAVHWAHGARDRFPDGALYAGLHGHAPGPRVQVSQILDTLLRTLGVHPDRIPLDLDGRSALFRAEIHGRHLLVVIDDALRPDQVRPLLPAAPGCMALVTSRSMLSGLVAREGARRLDLGVLAATDSVDLLRESVGQRVDAELHAAQKLVAHCACLPLALRVAAERLTERPESALSDLVGELNAEDSRLDSLAEEDELSDLRAVMAASYQALDAEAARFFRLLGLHPGPEFSAGAAAALTGTPLVRARRLLERLNRTHLVEHPRSGRYRLHDLVRLYAIERAREQDGAEGVRAAFGAVGRWYAHAAACAQHAEQPSFPVVPGGDRPEEVPVFTSVDEAQSWFETERANLVAVTEAALEHGHHDIAWRLPATVYPLFELHRHWDQWRDLHTLGLQAAEHIGDAFGTARNHLGMGDAQWLSGDLDAAEHHYRAARAANAGTDDPWVEGFVLRQLGELSWQS